MNRSRLPCFCLQQQLLLGTAVCQGQQGQGAQRLSSGRGRGAAEWPAASHHAQGITRCLCPLLGRYPLVWVAGAKGAAASGITPVTSAALQELARVCFLYLADPTVPVSAGKALQLRPCELRIKLTSEIISAGEKEPELRPLKGEEKNNFLVTW